MAYCEDYPCCGHTYDDPCDSQPYDAPDYYDTSLPGQEHNLCDHESGECDVYENEDEGEDCDNCNGQGWVRYGAGENLTTSPCSVCHSTGKALDDEPYVNEDAGMEFGLWGSEA